VKDSDSDSETVRSKNWDLKKERQNSRDSGKVKRSETVTGSDSDFVMG